jgi:hypothetical protein
VVPIYNAHFVGTIWAPRQFPLGQIGHQAVLTVTADDYEYHRVGSLKILVPQVPMPILNELQRLGKCDEEQLPIQSTATTASV